MVFTSQGHAGSVQGLLVCAALVAACGAAWGQEAAGRSVAAAEASCSGLTCLFSAAPAATPATTPAASAQATAAASVAALPDAADEAPVRAAKPRPVTVAVDASDAARLRALAPALPKSGVKFVDARDETADLRVTTAPRGAVQRIRLFTSQLHVIAGPGIKTMADLSGKVVSFGPSNGAARLAARKAFAALHIAISETPLDLENAFDGLASGDLDAVVMLAPHPAGAVAALRAPGLHLVNWPDEAAAPDGMRIAQIPQAAYPHLAKSDVAVRALGVDTVLQMAARSERRAAAQAVLAALAKQSAAATKDGVDLAKADARERTGRRVASANDRAPARLP